MSAQVFWAVFYSSQRRSQISPTADFDDAAIPAPIFSMVGVITSLCKECFVMRHNIGHSNAQPDIQIQKVIQVFLVSLSLILVCVRPSGSNKKQSRDVNPSQEIVSWVVGAVTCETYNLFFAVSLLLHHPTSQEPFIYYVSTFFDILEPLCKHTAHKQKIIFSIPTLLVLTYVIYEWSPSH